MQRAVLTLGEGPSQVGWVGALKVLVTFPAGITHFHVWVENSKFPILEAVGLNCTLGLS